MKYYLFPLGFILVSPWFLRLSAENIKMALPENSVVNPIDSALTLSLLVMFATGLILFVKNVLMEKAPDEK